MLKKIRKSLFLPIAFLSAIYVYLISLLFIDRNHFYAKLNFKEFLQEFWNPSNGSNLV